MVKAFISGQTQQKAHVTWKIAQLRNSHKAKVDEKSAFKSASIVTVEIDLMNTTTIEREILNRTLEYGVYYIEVMVTIESKNSTDCINYNYGFLRIRETPLHAVMSTKPPLGSILKGYHRHVELDASRSFDPDVKNPDESGLKYTWLCARNGEKFGNTALLPIVKPHGSGEVSNGKGCYGTGPGKLNFTGPSATLFLDHMEAEKSYVIQLIVEKDNRKKTVSYEFVLKTSNSFVLEIR